MPDADNRVESILKKARSTNENKPEHKKLSKSTKLKESYVVTQEKIDVKSFAVSEKSLSAHEKIFKGYIDSLNKISAKLDSVDRSLANANHSELRSLKTDETYNMNAAFLNSLYFDNIGIPESSIAIDSIAYLRLARDWGSFDAWQEDFISCAMSSRNGWVLTVYNLFLQRYMNTVIDLHSDNVPVGCIPVIVTDMWEHTYYRDYLDDKKQFVYKTMQELNWEVIEVRMKRADKVAKIYGGVK